MTDEMLQNVRKEVVLVVYSFVRNEWGQTDQLVDRRDVASAYEIAKGKELIFCFVDKHSVKVEGEEGLRITCTNRSPLYCLGEHFRDPMEAATLWNWNHPVADVEKSASDFPYGLVRFPNGECYVPKDPHFVVLPPLYCAVGFLPPLPELRLF